MPAFPDNGNASFRRDASGDWVNPLHPVGVPGNPLTNQPAVLLHHERAE